jgi:hypothetical protein
VSYKHDIFVSYVRNRETRAWLDDHFLPLLTLRVGQELARKVLVFTDSEIEAGVSWPPQLGLELGGSRVLISSDWCTEEMAHMLGREEECKLRTDANPRGVVVPVVIHDGHDFPPDLGHIQRFDIQQCFNVRMPRDSPRAEELDAILAREAPALAHAIQGAPPWRDEWPTTAAAQFRRTLRRASPSQRRPPGFTD